MKDRLKPLSFLIIGCLILFFSAPVSVILYNFSLNLDLEFSDMLIAFQNSFVQSVITATLCIVLSMLLVPGLSELKNTWIKRIMPAALLPSLLPSIFTLLIVFSLFRDFPFGTTGIVLIFFVTYFGMSTLILLNAYTALVGKYSHLIKIYNISLIDRYLKIYLPELFKDIITVFLIIVLGCFASLSVPLLAGGGRGTNVEMYIYESVFINGNWGTAAAMALLQMTIIFILGFYLNRISYFGSGRVDSDTFKTKKINLSLVFFLFYIGFYVVGYFYQLIKSLTKINLSNFYYSEFLVSLSNSFLLSFLTVSVFAIILVSLLFIFFMQTKSYFLIYFLLPSTTIIGLSLYLVFPERAHIIIDALKIALGINLIYTLVLYKSYIQPQLINIQSQLDVARIYNLTFQQSLVSVI